MVFSWLPFSHLLLFLFLSSATFSGGDDTTSPAIILSVCGQNVTRSQQSFDVNFVNSMEIVSQKIARTGFGTSVYGGSDTVYGLGQCFNYLSSVDCQLCYAESRVKLPHCLPSTTARIYLDGCFLRYSDRNVSDQAVDLSDTHVCGNISSTDAAQQGSSNFAQIAAGLVGNLTSSAYSAAGYYMAGSAAVPAPATVGMSVYGMAQCWRSLNESGCKKCLEEAGERVVRCLPAREGKALNAGCFVRYSTLPFFMAVDAQNQRGGGGRSSVLFWACVGLACIFATIVVIIGGAAGWRRWRSARYTKDADDGSSKMIRAITESHLGFKYENLRKATDNFNLINKLGQGGYGSVFKGTLPDGREIAIKRLFFNTRQWLDQFFNEVNLISQVQHKNLVKLLGCSIEGPESLLVYEYHSNRSLDNFLFDSIKKIALDWERRFGIIIGTAEGLAYLHDSSDVRIIHRDIKASNILLDERFKPKIADFGLARYFAEDQTHLSTGLAGTFGYMAPEYIVHGQLTEKADVYSYGILAIEIVTGRKNQISTDGHSLLSLIWREYTMNTMMDLLDPHLHGKCSEEEALRALHVGLLCTQASPNLRPPMWKVVEFLSSKSRDLPLPTPPPFVDVKGAHFKIKGSQSPSYFSSPSRIPVSVNQMSISIIQGR